MKILVRFTYYGGAVNNVLVSTPESTGIIFETKWAISEAVMNKSGPLELIRTVEAFPVHEELDAE